MPLNKLPGTTHTAITADHERRLRQPPHAGGVTGFAAYQLFPAAILGGTTYFIDIGDSANFTSHWTLQDSVGNHGTSLVDGQPHYSPGFYISQLFVKVDFGSDGTEAEFHLASVYEYVLGTAQFATAGNFAKSHTFSGCYYITEDTATDVWLSYLAAPPGGGAKLGATSFWHSITRLGDVPN